MYASRIIQVAKHCGVIVDAMHVGCFMNCQTEQDVVDLLPAYVTLVNRLGADVLSRYNPSAQLNLIQLIVRQGEVQNHV